MSDTNYTRTTNLGLYKPTYRADGENWGDHLNWNADTLDTALGPGGGIFLPLSGGTINPGPLVVGSNPFGATKIQLNPTTPNNQGTGTLVLSKVSGTHDGDDAQFNSYVAVDHSGGTAFYNNIRFQTNVTGNPTNVWATLSQSWCNQNSVGGGSHVGMYHQQVRTGIAAGGIGTAMWCEVDELRSQTGLPSSQDGVMQPIEIDLIANGADDLTTGIGRSHIALVLGQNNTGGAPVQATAGLSFFMMSGHAGSWKSMVFASAPAYVALDTRPAIAPAGVTDPFAAVRMTHEQIIDFNGSTATGFLDNHSPGRVLQYTTSGTARLRYLTGTVEVWSLDDFGNIVTEGGVTSLNNGFGCGSNVASSTTDLSHHLRLYSTTDGINITAGQWNFVAGGAAVASLTPSGINAVIGATTPAAGTFTSVIANGHISAHTGIDFNSVIASGPQDLSHGLDFYGGQYGLCLTAGELNYNTGSGSSHIFFAGSTQLMALSSSALVVAAPVTGNWFNVGSATGPNISTGSAVPATAQPAGSLYIRSPGAAGARLYVSQGGGTWAAVAGV